MASPACQISYKKSVEKELRKLSMIQRRAIVAKIRALATDPYPAGMVKLRGASGLFRIRHTDYRIVYQVNDGQLVIMIVKVGHRREIYREL